MTKQTSEFDRYAKDYEGVLSESIKISGFSSSYFAERKIKEIFGFFKKIGAENKPLNFLNYGCGTGNSERFIAKYFRNSIVWSLDISSESIDVARERNRELRNVFFETFDGQTIPFEFNFDVILIANVLHHVPQDDHIRIVKQLSSHLNNNGYIFIFEHNPFNPLTVKVVNSCPLDKNAVLLKPSYTKRILSESDLSDLEIRFIVFFPKCLSPLIPLERFMRKIPLGAQYYLVAKKSNPR